MAEVAPAPAAAASAKVPRKKPASKNKRSTLTVGELIVKAVSESKERNGMSLAALKKYLANGGYDVEKNKSRVKIAIKGLVNKGILIQTSGTGASGSFKLNKKQTEAKKSVKKAAPKVKKSAATRRSVVPKKSSKVKTKKTDTKKSPKKQKKVTNKKVVKTAKKSMASKKNTKSPKKGRSVKPKPVKSKAGKARKAPKKK